MGNTMEQPATPNSPVVETTPAVNTPVAPAPVSPQTPAAQPALTGGDDKLLAFLETRLSDMEKRFTQSSRDAATSAVNKALGVKKVAPQPVAQSQTPQQTVQQPAPVQSATQPNTPVTTETTDTTPTLDVSTNPTVAKAVELMQQDGVDVATAVDPVVLEAYMIQVRENIHLTAQDPELAMMDGSTMASYFVTTTAAVAAAKQRMIAEGTYQETDTDANSSLAIAAGLVNGNPVTQVPFSKLNGTDTLKYAFSHPERK